MPKMSHRLLSLLEEAQKTEYGKREGLPAVDYWRRVGGQNIGFIGAEGEGRPITGFPLIRVGLMKRTANIPKRKVIGVWGEVQKSDLHSKMFNDAIQKIDADKESVTMEQYKAAKSKAKARFESMIDDALSTEGMSRKDFEDDLKQQEKSERLLRVFASAKRKMLDANNAQYGVPNEDGSAYGNPAVYVVPKIDATSEYFRAVPSAKASAEKRREDQMGKLKSMFVDCQSIFAKYLLQSDIGKKKNIVMDYDSGFGRAYLEYKGPDRASDFSGSDAVSHLSGGGGLMKLFASANDLDKSAFHHEFGHFVERVSKRLYSASIRFLQERSGGDLTAYSIGDLSSDRGYDQNEFCVPDKFSEPYVGKIYKNSTEVSSMGIQNFKDEKSMLALYNDDRDLFYHSVGIMLGEY